MAKKNENKAESRTIYEELVKDQNFRKFIVTLMVKGRYLKSQGPSDSEYERGRKDAICSIVEDFVVGTDGGKELVAEYLDFVKDSKKEY